MARGVYAALRRRWRWQLLGDTLGDHDGDTLGDDIRLVSLDMKAPMATSLAMGAGS